MEILINNSNAKNHFQDTKSSESKVMQDNEQKFRSLKGSLHVPGDKSITHRSYILGSVVPGVVKIKGRALGEDCEATLECLKAMGAEGSSNSEDEDYEITSHSLYEPSEVLDAGNSGTTARLLLGLISGLNLFACITGDDSLKKRPMDRVISPLAKLGKDIRARQNNSKLPAAIIPVEMQNQSTTVKSISKSTPTIKTQVSSAQVKSALLLASLKTDGINVIESQQTRDHTERMLSFMGFSVLENVMQNEHEPESDQNVHQITLPGGQLSKLKPRDYVLDIPGDLSSAAFLITAALLVPGSQVKLLNCGLNPTRTGFVKILQQLGARITITNNTTLAAEPRGDINVEYSPCLQGFQLGKNLVPDTIDELPLLAVIAVLSHGTTKVSGAEELRYKESDRISAITQELTKLGADITETQDGFIVNGPTQLTGNVVDSHGDHRIAMALTVAALTAQGKTIIKNSDCINISYPGFIQDLTKLGAIIEQH
ncbi:3-phosphoshikimate 1-carboxyvinyltransferase [Natranaerobius thermophilus]|uniref:3-phosphoshikimate 1-carboxyvinyltransferase n=1 Tax=Natranaerobius thermophilus (strain ATCC BAA-1301 / DSM 18059 / JW/NM-WN-LF) TaxID=457570 RepID=B2A728_NATTJ|nr:3-phosphoshikimate 1-carboxyvinyltransferase [Natranaerobius thermophilus]ACB85619.1 3-phosphoshikimate 1-carboxyvinyltransferase [Natranaerobius thermophilus JW/NM-WN-LF]